MNTEIYKKTMNYYELTGAIQVLWCARARRRGARLGQLRARTALRRARAAFTVRLRLLDDKYIYYLISLLICVIFTGKYYFIGVIQLHTLQQTQRAITIKTLHFSHDFETLGVDSAVRFTRPRYIKIIIFSQCGSNL